MHSKKPEDRVGEQQRLDNKNDLESYSDGFILESIRHQVMEVFIKSDIRCQIPEERDHSKARSSCDCQELECDVEGEGIVITDTNAVIDPRAVMVEALDTMAADWAMPTAGGTNSVAIGA